MRNVLFTHKLRRRWYVYLGLAVLSFMCFYSLPYWNNDLQVIKVFKKGISTDEGPSTHCQMDTCFKYTNCQPLTSLSFKLRSINKSSESKLYAALLRSEAHVEENKFPPCITILVLNQCEVGVTQLTQELASIPSKAETNLVIWPNFVNGSFSNCPDASISIIQNVRRGSIVVNSFVTRAQYQHDYDIVPSYFSYKDEEVFSKPMPRRDILAYFDEACHVHRDKIGILYDTNKENKVSDRKLLAFSCSIFTTENCVQDDIAFKTSVFALISLPEDTNILSTPELQEKLFHILRLGSIPVVIGQRFLFPYSELIDWAKIGIKIPVEYFTDLPKILSSYSESVQEAMRINGRLVFNEYFSSLDKTIRAVLSTIHSRLNAPGIYHVSEFAEKSETAISFNHSGTQLVVSNQSSDVPTPYLSSAKWILKPQLWAQNLNGIETEFNSSSFLPSSLANEKFTIVIMTYKRVDELMKTLGHLNGLPKLDKIVVVWNSPDQPTTNLSWPTNMTIPIHVIKTTQNSLNNRFFPFDAIETDAVLSLDDDIYVSHDNLLFGFRVWQENRDRLVGFPDRAVTMDPKNRQWRYDTTHPYPLSLILTGCAFLHKMYHVLYTFEMSPLIRRIVDDYMNCEDIAMNFLISHRSQKPPIKVTTQVSFNCPTCGVAKNSLWTTSGHYEERNKCITEFSKIYGYVALFHTEYFASDLVRNRRRSFG